ncbi:MAG: FIST N-terminal domain-containing protein [Gallionella sp.]
MRSQQVLLGNLTPDLNKLQALATIEPQLLMVFGCVAHFSDPVLEQALRRSFPDALRIGCSTAGEIHLNGVSDGTTVVTAIHFDRTELQVVTTELPDMAASQAAGENLAQPLSAFSPDAVIVFGQGVNINGSAMIAGMVQHLGATLPITGGLAGDNGAFKKSYTLCNEGVSSSRLVALGLKGPDLVFAHSCYGGWKPFGPIRKVTRSENNILYELDDEPALELYKRYLGKYADDLPGSALLFPFEMLDDPKQPTNIMRTTLGINESDGSMIMAGEIKPGCYLRMMHAVTDALVDGADTAAQATLEQVRGKPQDCLVILISCVGRKMVMGARTEEEISQVRQVLGENVPLCGFYSNGEITPGVGTLDCKLHNQTMTITYLTEQTT